VSRTFLPREWGGRIFTQEYAGRLETEDRFYQILGELRRDREEQTRKWEEHTRKWDAQQAENREEFQRVHEEIMALARRQERSIGALGAR
jgi:hypothetical protein